MKKVYKTYKVVYDKTIPVYEIPLDYSFKAKTREEAFALMREDLMFDEFPLEDVLESGKSVFDEFNEYIDEHSKDD